MGIDRREFGRILSITFRVRKAIICSNNIVFIFLGEMLTMTNIQYYSNEDKNRKTMGGERRVKKVLFNGFSDILEILMKEIILKCDSIFFLQFNIIHSLQRGFVSKFQPSGKIAAIAAKLVRSKNFERKFSQWKCDFRSELSYTLIEWKSIMKKIDIEEGVLDP